MDDDQFTPRLGRQRAAGGKRARRYLGRVLAAANLARGGASVRGPRNTAFTGTRIGRGAGIGTLLARRGPGGAMRRRVVVKASIVKLAGKGAARAAAHIRYLQRDGTTREGERGALYSRDADAVDGAEFRERCSGDRHQFRFIVSPEDGHRYEDLKHLARRLMDRMEEDLGTRLDWVAVDHFNTGHPHTHIVVRGKGMDGADFVIARDYLTSGIRERAAELVDLDLGPHSQREAGQALRAEMGQERLTSIDRALLDAADGERVVAIHGRDAFDQSLRAGRLAKLARMELAEPLGAGRYRLDEDLADTLRHMGERGDIVRTMQREFTRAKVTCAEADQAIYDPAREGAPELVGRVLARGLEDEHADRHYLIVDATDGRSHYVAIGRSVDGLGESAGEQGDLSPGSIVRISPSPPQVREVDRTIAEVAAANGGIYDIDAHLRHDPSASETFAGTHVRRLEAMRRQSGLVERQQSGEWIVADDHLERVAKWQAARLSDRPVEVDVISTVPLEKLAGMEAATWIDRELVADGPGPMRDAGFGREFAEAKALRQRWLIGEGLATERNGQVTYNDNMIAALRRRELLRAAGVLSDELGLPFSETEDGEHIEGTLRRRLDLVSGRFAVVERSRDFRLVPWRPTLEKRIGEPVSGLVRGERVSWTFGRERSGPSIG